VDEEPTKGKVIIAPEVLMTVARLSALSVPGVARMAAVPGGVNRLFRARPLHEGVRIAVHDDRARRLYLVVGRGTICATSARRAGRGRPGDRPDDRHAWPPSTSHRGRGLQRRG
jgi:uncharacterized alkaline shock family protein YloU